MRRTIAISADFARTDRRRPDESTCRACAREASDFTVAPPARRARSRSAQYLPLDERGRERRMGRDPDGHAPMQDCGRLLVVTLTTSVNFR
jgi:hypothetical protein